jgi:hypothetical protein
MAFAGITVSTSTTKDWTLPLEDDPDHPRRFATSIPFAVDGQIVLKHVTLLHSCSKLDVSLLHLVISAGPCWVLVALSLGSTRLGSVRFAMLAWLNCGLF